MNFPTTVIAKPVRTMATREKRVTILALPAVAIRIPKPFDYNSRHVIGGLFKADSWEEVQEIDNTGVKEATKTMQLIMSNPTERDHVRARRDAQFDHRTQIRAAETRGEKKQAIASARRMKAAGIDPALITRITGLSTSEVAAL